MSPIKSEILTTNEARVLLRLRDWVSRERARYRKILRITTDPMSRERAYGEQAVLTMVIQKIEEMAKPKRLGR